MINSAKESISIYQQDLQDKVTLQALQNAIKRNVEVKICMSELPFSTMPNRSITNLYSIIEKGWQVRFTGTLSQNDSKPIHVHAKVLIVDHKMMYLGSTNFYPDILELKKIN